MLLRMLGWFRSRTTLKVFVLEIVAVFVGITASLFIDDWREERSDYEKLDHFFEEIHHNAIVHSSQLRIGLMLNNAAARSAVELLYGDTAALSEDEVLRTLWVAGLDSGFWRGNIGYDRLSQAALSIPFNETMAQLDEIQSLSANWTEVLRRELSQIRDGVERVLADGGLVYDFAAFPEGGLTPGALAEWSQVLAALTRDGQTVYAEDNRARARAALEQPPVRQQLKQILQRRTAASRAYLGLIGYSNSVVAAIRQRLPEVTLPVKEIGVAGSATGLGWDVSVPLKRAAGNPHLWRGTVELTDGELKFRADNAWSTNWGGPQSRMDILSESGWSFTGDPGEVFPSGVADFNGSNIPVQAGRYRVTFNSRTFEYSFERIP